MQRLTNCKYCGHQYEYMTYNDRFGEVERHELCQNCGHTVDKTYGQGTDNTEWYEDALKYRELSQHVTLDRLRELVQADAEGRAVIVNPCKTCDAQSIDGNACGEYISCGSYYRYFKSTERQSKKYCDNCGRKLGRSDT